MVNHEMFCSALSPAQLDMEELLLTNNIHICEERIVKLRAELEILRKEKQKRGLV